MCERPILQPLLSKRQSYDHVERYGRYMGEDIVNAFTQEVNGL